MFWAQILLLMKNTWTMSAKTNGIYTKDGTDIGNTQGMYV